MRICHVTDTLPGYHKIWGGAERATVRLIEALGRHGVENHACSIPPEKEVKEAFSFHPLKTLDSLFPERIAKIIRKVKRVWYSYDPVSCRDFRKLLISLKPDVVHFHNINILSISLVKVAKELRIPTVMGIYDYWAFCPKSTLIDSDNNPCKEVQGEKCVDCTNPPSFKGVHAYYLRRRGAFFKPYLDSIGAFAVLSESSASVLKRCGIDRDRISTIRQIFPFASFRPISFEGIDRHSILLVGWVQHRKGAHVLIEAMSGLIKEFPDVRLNIVGELVERDYLGKLQEFIEKNGLSNNVFIRGRVSEEELEGYFKKAHVLAIAEQWENMSPVVLLEGMAKAKAIVAGNIGGIPEFLKDGLNGCLAEFNNPTDFADKIRQIFRRCDLGEGLGKAARTDVETMFEEKAVIEGYVRLYEELIRQDLQDKNRINQHPVHPVTKGVSS